MLKYLKLFSISLLSLATSVHGDTLFSKDKFDFGGTASIYVNSTTDGVSWFNSKSNPLGYSQATIFGQYTPFNNMSFRGEAQLIEGKPRINYVLTDISGGNLDLLYGVRVGKIQRETGLYDGGRFNPARRRFIYLPTVVYYPAAEEWLTSAVGGQVYVKKSLFNNAGSISLEVDRGFPWQSNLATEHQFSQIYGGLEIDDPDNLEHFASTIITTILRYRDWKFQVAYSPDTRWKYTPTTGTDIPENEANQETIWAGVEYRDNKWLASAEGYYTTIATEYPLLPVSNSDLAVYTYAATVGYDFTNKFQLSGYTSQVFLISESDVFTTGGLQRATTRLNQRDSAISAIYKITPRWNLRAEAHYFNGNPINLLGFGSDNSFPINEDKNWALFTVGVDFIF